jgi:hypothetical protein
MKVSNRMFQVSMTHNHLTRLALNVRAGKDEEFKREMKAQAFGGPKFRLTDVEYLQWLASEQQSVLKYMLREERHGDRDKEADLPADDEEED